MYYLQTIIFSNEHTYFNILYTDNIIILISENVFQTSFDEKSQLANQTLNQIFDWLKANKLSLNVSNISNMLITNKKTTVNFQINNIYQ